MGDKFSIQSIRVCWFVLPTTQQIYNFKRNVEKQFSHLGNKNEKLVNENERDFSSFSPRPRVEKLFHNKNRKRDWKYFQFCLFFVVVGAPSCVPPYIHRQDLPPCRQILMCIWIALLVIFRGDNLRDSFFHCDWNYKIKHRDKKSFKSMISSRFCFILRLWGEFPLI